MAQKKIKFQPILLIFIFLSCLRTFADNKATKIRFDLYQKIKKETGVSLKEIFQHLEGKNHSVALSLQTYANRTGTKKIKKFLKEEIFQRQEFCKKRASVTCTESIEELKYQFNFLTNMEKNLDSQNKYKKIYFYLVIYNFNIKNIILKNEYLNWEKSCSSLEKANTIECQEKLYGFHILVDIATELAQVAFQKSEKAQEDKLLISSLKEKISIYEK